MGAVASISTKLHNKNRIHSGHLIKPPLYLPHLNTYPPNSRVIFHSCPPGLCCTLCYKKHDNIRMWLGGREPTVVRISKKK